MSYDCPMLCCIQARNVNRYLFAIFDSLIKYGKIAKPWKKPNFLKNFLRILRKISRNSAKNHENFLMELELSFTLNSFKISRKSSDFSVKIFNFLKRSRASPPSTHYAASTKLLSFVLGADTRNLGKKYTGKRKI